MNDGVGCTGAATVTAAGLAIRAVSVTDDADFGAAKLNAGVAGVVELAAATAASPTEGIEGKAQLNNPGDELVFTITLSLDLWGIDSTASRLERSMASVEVRSANLTARGRCLASSMGVCNSLKVSRIFFATEAEA